MRPLQMVLLLGAVACAPPPPAPPLVEPTSSVPPPVEEEEAADAPDAGPVLTCTDMLSRAESDFQSAGFPDAKLTSEEPDPRCAGGDCRCVFAVQSKDELTGTLFVEPTSSDQRFEPDDGRGMRWKPLEYRTHLDAEARVISLVVALPEVKTYCKTVVAQGRGCLSFVDSFPDADCNAACVWLVYVGEAVPDSHSSRRYTFHVDAEAKRVVAVSGLTGEPIPLSRWRSLGRP